MKKPMIFVIAFLMLGTTSVLSQNSTELQGAWEITYQQFVTSDTTMERTQFTNPTVKILSKEHFSFGSFSDDGETLSGGGGKYSYDGKIYIEHVKYHGYALVVGKSIEFKSKIEGDKWTIKGVVPGVDGDIKLKEIWKRID
jgi:hypothetical protein